MTDDGCLFVIRHSSYGLPPPSVPRFDFHAYRAIVFGTENLPDRHANVPLAADAAFGALRLAKVAIYAGSTAVVSRERFFCLGSG